MLVGRTVNTYLAVLIIAVVGAAAAHVIIQVGMETYYMPTSWSKTGSAQYTDLQNELLNN